MYKKENRTPDAISLSHFEHYHMINFIQRIIILCILVIVPVVFPLVSFTQVIPNDPWQPKVTPRNQWYYNTLFTIHLDHHVGPDIPAPGAGCNEDQILRLLEMTKPGFVQFHAKGGPGYTTYPTKVASAYTVPNLKNDMIRIWRNATKKMGTKFTVYYAGPEGGPTLNDHPEWVQKNVEPRSGKIACRNSRYVDEFMLPQFKELLLDYDVDGFWIDGDNYSLNACVCDVCKKLFRDEYGLEPPQSRDDKVWDTYAAFQRKSWLRYLKKVNDFVHGMKPTAIVTSNWSCTSYQPEPTPDFVDWISADIGGVRRIPMVLLDARYLDAEETPWDIMVGHTLYTPDFRYSEPKSVDYLNQENAITLAAGGRVNIWHDPRPDASLSEFQMRQLENASQFAYARKEVSQGTEPVRDVAILYSATTFFKDGSGYYYSGMAPVMDRIRGANLSLIQNHTHFQILNDAYLLRNLKQYRVVVVSHQTALSTEMLDALRRWVDSGGNLIVTGLTAAEKNNEGKIECSIEDLLGVRFTQRDTIPDGYVPSMGYPQRINATFYPVETTTAQTAISLVKDWNEVHPETLPLPAMTVNKFGKGKVVYIPADIYSAYWKHQFIATRSFLAKAMELANPDPLIQTDAPKSVMFSLRKKGRDLIVHGVNLNADWDMNLEGAQFIETVLPVGPLTFKIKCENQPVKIRLVPDESPVEWRWDRDGVWVTIPKLHIHSAVVLEKSYK